LRPFPPPLRKLTDLVRFRFELYFGKGKIWGKGEENERKGKEEKKGKGEGEKSEKMATAFCTWLGCQ